MKRLFLAAAIAMSIAGCATPVNPQQAFINEATTATQTVDQTVLAADAAVRANVLKGKDAANAQAILGTAIKGIKDARTLAVTDPSGALILLRVHVATLTALQIAVSTGSVK